MSLVIVSVTVDVGQLGRAECSCSGLRALKQIKRSPENLKSDPNRGHHMPFVADSHGNLNVLKFTEGEATPPC